MDTTHKKSRSRSRSRSQLVNTGENTSHVTGNYKCNEKKYNTACNKSYTIRRYRKTYFKPAIQQQNASLNVWRPFFMKLLFETPVYTIMCHGALRITTGKDTFKLDKSSYILNLTAGGEYCVVSPHTLLDTLLLSDTRVKTYLASEDIEPSNRNPLLTSMYRATDCMYPQFTCWFDDSKITPGVFLNNSVESFIKGHTHITPADNILKHLNMERSWTLEQIINTVKSITNNPHGIFIFAGCSDGPALPNHPVKLLEYRLKFNAQREIIRLEELKYSSKVPTRTKEKVTEFNSSLVTKDPGLPGSTYHTIPGAHALADYADDLDLTNINDDEQHKNTARRSLKHMRTAGHKK